MFKFPNGSLELMLAGFYMKVSVEGVYRLSVRPFSPHASECHVYGWLPGSRQSRVIYELPGCGLLDVFFRPYSCKLYIKGELYPEQTRDFKRLSLGGYGGLRYIKSIWVERPHPGDHIPGVHIPPGAAYSRGAIRKRGILRRKWPHEKSIDSQ